MEHRVVSELDGAARALDPAIVARLADARRRALAARRAGAGARLSARLERWLAMPALRPALLAGMVLAVFVLGNYMGLRAQIDEYRAVDTALLIDDLPIDAYLDPDFRAWLRQERES
ncbi:MAG: DUF3619 family protein [Rhodocyclaceae bacterium]